MSDNFFFFFSSRRRHTRYIGDWSSDVCSSDLNWAEFAYVFFACERVGAVANQIGPDYRSREVEYILRFSESRAYVAPASFKDFDYVAMIKELRPGLPALESVLVLGGTGLPGTVPLDELIAGRLASSAFRPPAMDANDVMRMAFTSGTTGNPKGVMHSFTTTLPACRILNEAMAVGERDVLLAYLPLGLNWGYLTLRSEERRVGKRGR